MKKKSEMIKKIICWNECGYFWYNRNASSFTLTNQQMHERTNERMKTKVDIKLSREFLSSSNCADCAHLLSESNKMRRNKNRTFLIENATSETHHSDKL